MGNKIQVELTLDLEHDYIRKNGTDDLAGIFGDLIAVRASGKVLSQGQFTGYEEDTYIFIEAEICRAAHRLMFDNYISFLDVVFGEEFTLEHGISKLVVTDFDEAGLAHHESIIRNSW